MHHSFWFIYFWRWPCKTTTWIFLIRHFTWEVLKYHWFFFIKILGELKWSRGLQREQTILRVMNGPCLAGTVSLKFAPPTKTERLLAKPSSLSVGNEIHALHGKHHEVCPRPNPHLNVSNRPFALRCPMTSFLWKWKLCDFAFKKRLVGHILNKIIVIWFFKPAPFS